MFASFRTNEVSASLQHRFEPVSRLLPLLWLYHMDLTPIAHRFGSGQRLADALWGPASVLPMTGIAGKALL